ncbi:hypothetical protein H2200_011944 [Cladophialophora chaetospira]|uniref:SUN domain-containing protein n=1 Tax=Cladophialophora chaetospira TaxID=386627 RepID=A0AA39CCZ6_9EURO|nr:hypothetical protein H2200_011944 [Cladophialophora chaetospira]
MRFWRHAFLGLSFILLDLALAATPSSRTTPLTPSTSPYRTFNYITHTLPQQCLPSSRKANGTLTALESNSSSTLNPRSTTQSATEGPGTLPSVVPSSSDAASIPQNQTTSPVPSVQEHSSRISSQTEIPNAHPTTIPDGADEDSPLDDGKFLSFEDWKRDNLKKSGQSEHIGRGPGAETLEPRKRPPGLRDSLDSLGDDAEIDLDFSGFVSDGLEPPNQSPPRPNQGIRDGAADIEPGRPPKAGVRSKDAGTTCKERFNYASFDCAANVLKWNPEAKTPSAVLGENKDSYMLNECSAQNKFLILELCNDISIDTIVVANFEFFSSTFRTFRVSVSDKYPVKVDKWKTLGTFEARNSREVQAFLVENPVIWARYLRIEFLTQYGNEFYCPISLVRVHGTTMLEDYKRDLEALQMDEDDDKAAEESSSPVAEDGLVPEAVAEQLLTELETSETAIPTNHLDASAVSGASQPQPVHSGAPHAASTRERAAVMPTCPAPSASVFDDPDPSSDAFATCSATEGDMTTPHSRERTEAIRPSSEEVPSTPTNTSLTSSIESTVLATNTTTTNMKASVTTSRSDAITDTKLLNTSLASTPANGTRTIASSTQSPQPAPTMQESFFKSVQKRLQMLEANSSLSLQYIEDQSRALRGAFQKVEQRQLAKTTSFLDYLNTTVLNELREFRQQYDQLWQSTVIELEMQRERYQRENLAINARLGVLADEIIFQKRMSFLQLILIVVCLGLVLFSKGNMNSYLELPLVQSVLSRSPSTRFLNAISPDTPNQSSPVSRSNSAGAVRQRLGILKGHRRFPSDDSIQNATSPIDLYTPPTPVSYGDPSSEGDVEDDSNILGDPEFDPSLIERPRTSPPVLTGIESPVSDYEEGIADDSIDSVLNSTPTNSIPGKAPILIIEDASPTPKQLKWQLPDG